MTSTMAAACHLDDSLGTLRQDSTFDMFLANGIASRGMTGGLGDFNVQFTRDP